MRREEQARFWLGLLLALLLARSLRALLSTLFYQSLATLRLNESAWWMLVLLAPALATLLTKRAHVGAVLVAGVATSALPFARFTPAYLPLAALASAVGLGALVRSAALPGALAGLALDGALLVLGHSREPSGAFLPAALALAALALVWRVEEAALRPRGWAAGAAAGALLAVELAFLASPYSAARWAGIPAWGAAAASGLGLILGATRLRHAGRWIWVVGALGLVDLALARSPFVALSLALVQTALGVAAARLAPSLSARGGSIAFALVFAALTFVLLFFRSPLGVSEWGALVPLLALQAVAPAAFAPRAERVAKRLGAIPSAALLALVAVSGALVPAMAEPSGEEIRVVSWNVHQAFGNRGALDPEIYAEVLRGLAPDVVLLQESDTARLSSGGLDIVKYLAEELGMRGAYGRSGAAVLSRFPLADAPRPEEAYWSFEVALDVNGTELWVHSVHLARGRFFDDRVQQIGALLEEEPRGHHIVAGDLNMCATGSCFGVTIGRNGTPIGPAELNPLYEDLTARYEDAWVAAGNALVDPAGNTHSARNPSRRIDHILAEGIEVIEVRPVLDERTRLGSDHLPVFARLRLAGE